MDKAVAKGAARPLIGFLFLVNCGRVSTSYVYVMVGGPYGKGGIILGGVNLGPWDCFVAYEGLGVWACWLLAMTALFYDWLGGVMGPCRKESVTTWGG
jgi:hypothetical protein